MDDELDEPANEALPGHAAEAGGADLAEVLLALTGETCKLAVVLSELDQASFSKLKSRLQIFLSVVEQIPREASKKGTKIRVIGFAPKKKR